jgi:hypothetical protein
MLHRLLVLFALPLLLTPTLSPAAQTTKVSNPVAVAAACAGIEIKTKMGEGCSTLLQKTLSADPAVLKALQAASKTNDQKAAKALLLKAGLTQQQLTDARVVFKDQTGGSSRIKDVTITISCCPLTITITIRL